ncbi:MAG: ester cyclase [Candidatus Eiseniibacteriota bacterium]
MRWAGTSVFATVGALLAILIATKGAGAAPSRLDQLEANERDAKAHLAIFDTLDYTVFTYQQWERLHESHSKDVIVHWPDGHQTQGIEKHIEDLKEMFVYAPDTRIKVHTVKIGTGEWTSVIGIMEGTFTQRMPTATGSIPPTGKPFKITMCTVGHWKNGVMDEEYLFWDNLTFLKQIGLGG